MEQAQACPRANREAWRDGTSPLLFEPIELLEKLAAITPRPAITLVLYHGVLAPQARGRSPGVRSGRAAPDSTARSLEARPRPAGTPGPWTWAALMHRVFDRDVLACPRWGGRLRVIAPVQDPLAVQAILAHLARSGAPRAARPRPTRARRPHVARSSVLLSMLPLPPGGAPPAPPPHPAARFLTARLWRRRMARVRGRSRCRRSPSPR